VLSVSEVADPGLEGRRVVLPDLFPIRLVRGLAGDGGPLAGWLEEGEVDVRV